MKPLQELKKERKIKTMKNSSKYCRMETVIKKWQKKKFLPEVDDFPCAKGDKHWKINKIIATKEK